MGGCTVSALMRAEITAVLVAHPRPMSTREIAQQIVGRGQAQPRTAGYFAGDIYPYLRQLEGAGEVVRTRRHDGRVCVYWELTSGPDSAWAEAVGVSGVVDLDMPAGAVIGGEDLGSDALDVSSTSAVDEEVALRALLDVRNRQIAILKAQVAEHDRTIDCSPPRGDCSAPPPGAWRASDGCPGPRPMTGTQVAVGYHWSPASRRAGIEADGLRIGSAPVVNGVEDVHRNRWMSLCPTPTHAWWLSAGALHTGGFGGPELNGAWDLYEVDVSGLAVTTTSGAYPEVRVAEDIEPNRITWVARRQFDEA